MTRNTQSFGISSMSLKHLIALSLVVLTTQAQSSCQSSIAPQHAAPSVAPGFRVEVVANKLRTPRGILFDPEGGLLVVEQGHGISRLRLTGAGSCVKATGDVQTVIEDDSLNHGIALSEDGRILYGSSFSDVFSWNYNASQGLNTSSARTVIQGLGGNGGHTTRTLLLSKKAVGLMLISRGSQGNIDPQALDITTGISTIKAFNVANITTSAYEYASDGLLLGWGLRNSVGVAEEPVSGALYSVENSVDNIQRNGQTFNQNNPGEEMNFHGYLNGTKTKEQGGNFGYPTCFAAWNVSEIPDFHGTTGTQFAIGDQNATVNDTFCQNDRIAPRITFAAHMAPLDIKFNPNGTAGWVTFHGSWNSDIPIGYKLSLVQFDGKGSPIAPANSTTAAIDIVSNSNITACPQNCFRPVGLAWDKEGRLFMSSDATGEIYVVTKEDGSGISDVRQIPTSSSSPTGGTSTPSPTGNHKNDAVSRWGTNGGNSRVVTMAFFVLFLLG